ncbi:MAG: selenium cofactor biosynthesis protein YqeC, partial [Peptostreptococcaceae bacterium]
MRIFEFEDNKVVNKEYLYKALGLDLSRKYVISFVGGGGKTSSIYKLAYELASFGKKVIVTTTTHMQMPKDKVVLNDNISEVKDILEKNNFVTVGVKVKVKVKDDKITSVSEDVAMELSGICDFLLIEADGAKMLPLKVPADHEPVILNITNMVIGICGIDALGKKINKTCHRANIVSKLLNKDA